MIPSDTHPDVARVQRLSAVPNILQVVAETTGAGLALVARVTGTEWTACAVLDRINFGLKAGDPLELSTTLCREVRESMAPIIIDHASADPRYCDHPTPKLYKFERGARPL